jgi:hypothetical protein
MFGTTWRHWLKRLSRTVRSGGPQHRRKPPQGRRLEMERLEDRLAPATNITIIATGTGNLDHFLSASNGTITTANDPGDTAATLSVGALEGVGPGVTISITADATIHFNDLGTLALQTGTGVNAGFTTTTGTIDFANLANTVTTGGGSLSFSAGTNLTVANLNTGSGGGGVLLTAGTTGPAGAGGNLTFENIATNAGNLTFSATGGTGGGSNPGTITQSGVTTAAGAAINATATSSIAVNALKGTSVTLTSSQGSISSTGTAAVQASAQLTLSAKTGITLNTLANFLQASNSTSGNISITQAASPQQTLTVNGTGVINNVSGGTITLDNLGASITVNSGNGVVSTNGAITLAATDLQIDGAVNAGTGIVTLENSTAGRQIDVGTNTAGKIGLTNSELAEVTASVLRIGDPSLTSGNINVTAAITNPAGWNTLALYSGDTITEAAAGSLTVPNLRATATNSVTLTSANDVGTLAGDTSTASTASFSFSNGTNLLTVGVVDGDTGIVTSGSDIHLIADDMDLAQQVTTGSSSAGVVNLEPFTATRTINLGTNTAGELGLDNGELNKVTAGVLRIGSTSFTGNITVSAAISPANIGALSLITTSTGTITQGSSDTITVAGGAGGLAVQANTSVTLNEANDVGSLAAAITGAGNNFEFTNSAGFTVSTVDSVVGISTATGTTETVVLTAGGSVSQNTGADITSQNLLLLGTGGYTLTNVGNDVATLAANVTNAVSYTDANDLTVGTVTDPATSTATVGVTTSGADIAITASASTSGTTLTVSQAIDTISDANITLTADQMSLLASVNAHAGIVTLEPTTAGRAVTLGTVVSGTLSLLQTDLNNVSAGVLRVGNLTSSGSITVTAPISDATTGFTTLSLLTELGAGISQNSGATLTVTNLNAAGNTGVILDDNNVVSTLAGATQSGAFSFVDSTNLTVDNVDSGLGSGFGSGIITQGQAVNLTVNVLNDSLTVNQTINTTHNFGTPAPGGANINLSADNMALNNNSPSSTINAGTGGILTLTPFTPANTIAVGGPDAAGQLGIDNNDLSNVTAKVVRIGSSAQTGAVTVDGTITTHTGYNTLDLIATGSGGAITQTTGSIAVANLALQANAGIGSSPAIQVVGPINLAFDNTTSNNVQITSSGGALTINSVDGVTTSANHTLNGTVSLQAGTNPLTFAVNTSSSGTLSATTTEPASETTGPEENITVNMNVAVESVGGDVDLTAGDSISTDSGSLLLATNGTVDLTAGMGDTDTDAVLTIGGTISAANITLSSPGDVGVNGLSATGTVTVTSTNGAILDTGDPTGGDGTDITASTVNLNAATGIGVNGPGVTEASNAALEIQASTLSFSNSTSGDVDIINVSGDLSASGTNSAPGGAVNLTVENGNMLTVNASNISSTNNATGPFTNNITLTADTMTLTGTVNAGSAIVTLQPFTSARPIDLGTNPSSGKLGLAQGDLNNVTASILRIGSSSAGSITVTAAITAPAGWSTLSLLTGGGVSETGSGALTVGSLAVQAASGIDLSTNASAVSNVAATSTPSGGFNLLDSVSLTVTSVDGVAGISTDGGILLESSVANTSLTVSTSNPVTTNGDGNITFIFDNMTLSAAVTASGHRVTLEPFSSGQLINVGGANASGTLGLNATSLGNVTASTLQIGDSSSGNLTVSAALTFSNVTTLDLETGGGIVEGGGGSLTVADLALRATSGIGSTTALAVVGPINVAFDNTTSGAVQITSSGAMTINSVDGLTASANNGGAVTLKALQGPLTFAVNTTGSGTISATTTEATTESGGPEENITVNSSVTVESTGGNVSFTAGDSITTDSGSLVKSDSGTVSLTIGQGDTDSDAVLTINGTLSGNISITEPGTIVLDNLPTTITDQPGKTVTLTSTTGAILDSTNPADTGDDTDVTAASLGLSAATGIGTATDNIITAVATLAATTATGGIFLTNTGALSVGTVGAVSGVTVTGASGDISLVNNGTLDVLTNGAVISGPGNVTVKSIGNTSDIQVGAQSSLTSINGSGSGTVDVEAGRDLVLGDNTGFGSVNSASGSIVLKAGRDIDLNANAAVTVSSGTGTLTATAVGDLNMTTSPGTLANAPEFATTGGAIALTAATFTAASTGTNAVFSSNGNITISADTQVLNAGIDAGTGTVTLQQAGTATRNIDVGLGTTLNTLDLSNAELGEVTAGTLRIGRTDNAGNLSVTAALSSPAGASILDLRAGGTISQTSGSTITVNELAAQGGGGVSLGLANQVSTLAGTASNNPFTFTDVGPVVSSTVTLTVGTVDGVSGINAGSGAVDLTVGTGAATGILIDPTNNGGSAVVTGGTVTLDPLGPSDGITGQIGFFSSGSAKFFEVAATTIDASTDNSRAWIALIGGAAVGSVDVGTDTAFLKTVNGNLTSTHTGSTPDVLAASVNLSSPGTSGSFGTAANPLLVQTSTLKASVTGTGSINVTNVAAGGNLAVTSATTTNGAINLGVAGGNLTTTAASGTDISAPGNTVTLSASGAIISGTGSGITDVAAAQLTATAGTGIGTSANPLKTAVATLSASGGSGGVFVTNTGALTLGTVSATGASISVSTSGALTVPAGASVQDSGGPVTLTADTSNSGVTITLDGVLSGTAVNVFGGDASDTFNIDVAAGSYGAVTVSAVASGAASDDDTFNVTPSSNGTTYFINGSDGSGPTEAVPGDTLTINFAGTTGNALSATPGGDDFSGTYTFHNRDSVVFTAMDNLSALPPVTPIPTPSVTPALPPPQIESAAFGPKGEVIDVVLPNGILLQFDNTGVHVLAFGVLSVDVAFNHGKEVLEVVFAPGILIQFDKFDHSGPHRSQVLATGVLLADVSFSHGKEVLDVLFQSGFLVQFDSTGTHVLGSI